MTAFLFLIGTALCLAGAALSAGWAGASLAVRICLRARLEVKLADLWVGAFWRVRFARCHRSRRVVDVWVCLVPCVPLHVSFEVGR